MAIGRIMRGFFKPVGETLIGALAVGLLRFARAFNADRFADFAAAFMRRIGPLLKEHDIGRANLRAAFPEKSDAEIEAILEGVWDNLGRVGAEFAHIDHIWDFDPDHPAAGRVEFSEESKARFERLRDDGKPALIFAAHIANWELPALAGPAHGLPSAVLYRRPNVAAVNRAIERIRAVNMGEMVPTTMDAPLRLAKALEAGKHVGMLMDQHTSRGVEVMFFGRPVSANPLLARLARQIECPIHGTRIIRLPHHRFRAELSEEIEPVREADGTIDVIATTQKITSVIENWVREYPEQWLWLHRRWRQHNFKRRNRKTRPKA